MSKKLISLFLVIILSVSAVLNCFAEENDKSSVHTELFIHQELFRQYSLVYDTFNASIVLEDGTEITGIGFSDYSAYYEAEDGSLGFFPAGFIADCGYEIPKNEAEKGLVIENLDFSDEKYQFVFDYETTPFMEHCVRGGQYLKYGVNEHGAITYETSTYQRGVCDESLGALYSYDENRFVFDPDFGNYIQINGISLFDQIDYTAVEAQINQILAEQDANFSHQEVVTSVQIAQEAITSYLLSMQEETFLGYKVSDLVESASHLDPMQCIRVTPEGFVTIDIIDTTPQTADEMTKWLVGAGCLIMVAGSVALEIFVPAARPLSGAIMGGAIDVFMQVVVENKSLENVQWGKVAVAAASGAMMAWVCPLAAASTTTAVIQAGAGEVMGKIAGYGVLTLSNGLVAGVTNAALSVIDGKEDGWNAFLIGAAIGAAGTALVSVLSEAVASPKVAELVSRTKPGKWLKSATETLSKTKPAQWLDDAAEKADLFIQKHQVRLFSSDKIEKILAPKSVHMAAKSALAQYNEQTSTQGGKYSKLITRGDGTQDRHEIPSCSAYNKAKGIKPGYRHDLPAVLVDKSDHAILASTGSSPEALAYQAQQYDLIRNGNITAAIKMDIDDIHSKLGTKYDEGIRQALKYALQEGWWNPWTENTGLLSQLLLSVDLTLEEIVS